VIGCVTSSETFHLDLGGTIVDIKTSAPAQLDRLRLRYAGFECSSPTPTMVIHLRPVSALDEGTTYRSRVDKGGETAVVYEDEETEVLDGVLRTMLPRSASPDIIAHGALLADHGRGFLCCGPSGSGKSTIAALFSEKALCDELARISMTSKGPVADSLPFWKARPMRVLLDAIFILEHSSKNWRRRLEFSEAITELKPHLYWPVDDHDALSDVFSTLVDVVRRIPVFRLGFQPDRNVWSTIVEQL